MSFINWNAELPREWQTNEFSHCFQSQLPIECIEMIRRYWITEVFLLKPPSSLDYAHIGQLLYMTNEINRFDFIIDQQTNKYDVKQISTPYQYDYD